MVIYTFNSNLFIKAKYTLYKISVIMIYSKKNGVVAYAWIR